MVSYIVKNDVEPVLVSDSQHLMQFLLGGKAFLNLSSKDRPITVVTRELGIGLGIVVLVAIRELIHAPCIPWVLGDRRNPNGVDTELGEEAFFDFLCDTCDVTTLVVHDVEYLWAVHLPVVGFVAIVETVNHERVEHLCLVVVTSQLCNVADYFAILQWDEQVVEAFAVAHSIYSDETTTFALAPCWLDGQCCFRTILLVVDVLGSTGVLPQYTELEMLVVVEHTNGDGRVGE